MSVPAIYPPLLITQGDTHCIPFEMEQPVLAEISNSAVGNPALITTNQNHCLSVGERILIRHYTDCGDTNDGCHVVSSVESDTQFRATDFSVSTASTGGYISRPVNLTGHGFAGSVSTKAPGTPTPPGLRASVVAGTNQILVCGNSDIMINDLVTVADAGISNSRVTAVYNPCPSVVKSGGNTLVDSSVNTSCASCSSATTSTTSVSTVSSNTDVTVDNFEISNCCIVVVADNASTTVQDACIERIGQELFRLRAEVTDPLCGRWKITIDGSDTNDIVLPSTNDCSTYFCIGCYQVVHYVGYQEDGDSTGFCVSTSETLMTGQMFMRGRRINFLNRNG